MLKQTIKSLIIITAISTACGARAYPDIRQLFTEAGNLFVEYRVALQAAPTSGAAVDVMKNYNMRLEELIQRKDQVLARYPEFSNLGELKRACDKFEEFQAFRREFANFYQAGDAVARKFEKDKNFKAESIRGRRLILRMI